MQHRHTPRIFRLLRALVSLVALASWWKLPLYAVSSIALGDLDLSRIQTEDGPVGKGENFRSETGFFLRAGSSLWVDLKNDAEELRATVQPLPGSRGSPVRCRFATANDVYEVLVRADSAPTEMKLPLVGQDLLVVEVLSTAPGESAKVHIASSSLSTKSQRPEAIDGGAPLDWATPEWRVQIDGRSGGITHLSHPKDAFGMEWIRQAAPWGTGWARIDGATQAWTHPAKISRLAHHGMEATYEMPGLRVRVERHLESGARLKESYTFENTGTTALALADDALGIRLPLVDSYPGAEVCLPQRCHVHLWMGGSTSYVNAMRMGGAAPHLGLVLNKGSLSGYSIHNRITHSNDRGQFVVHPSAMTLAPGEKAVVSWTLFWHQGWDDFYQQIAQSENVVRLEAERYTVTQGEPLRLSARANHPLDRAQWSLNGQAIDAGKTEGAQELKIELQTPQIGEQVIGFEWEGKRTWLRALVTPPPLDLIKNRVRFIVEHQQKHEPGSHLDGAYLIYDNETNQLVYESGFADHNAARERLGMGVLAALYLPQCDDPYLREAITRSLQAYAAFVAREVQSESGTVFNDARRSGPTRMYNYPWAVHFHLAMYDAFGRPEHLRRALDACRAYYTRGGERFYCIGMPVTQMLSALERAGWSNERKEMLAAFKKHATTLLRIGSAYPKHEVNYEQSIVGPAAQLMLEVYLATGEQRFLQGAKEQLELLELFGGHQPDYHLNDIPIRHWDDYWFGKRKVYADTFPHYWSTITASVFALYAQATGDSHYRRRADAILANNLCSFTPEGRASCAYVYPTTANGNRGQFFDPWANDQDWALVNWWVVHKAN